MKVIRHPHNHNHTMDFKWRDRESTHDFTGTAALRLPLVSLIIVHSNREISVISLTIWMKVMILVSGEYNLEETEFFGQLGGKLIFLEKRSGGFRWEIVVFSYISII